MGGPVISIVTSIAIIRSVFLVPVLPPDVRLLLVSLPIRRAAVEQHRLRGMATSLNDHDDMSKVISSALWTDMKAYVAASPLPSPMSPRSREQSWQQWRTWCRMPDPTERWREEATLRKMMNHERAERQRALRWQRSPAPELIDVNTPFVRRVPEPKTTCSFVRAVSPATVASPRGRTTGAAPPGCSAYLPRHGLARYRAFGNHSYYVSSGGTGG